MSPETNQIKNDNSKKLDKQFSFEYLNFSAGNEPSPIHKNQYQFIYNTPKNSLKSSIERIFDVHRNVPAPYSQFARHIENLTRLDESVSQNFITESSSENSFNDQNPIQPVIRQYSTLTNQDFSVMQNSRPNIGNPGQEQNLRFSVNPEEFSVMENSRTIIEDYSVMKNSYSIIENSGFIQMPR